MKDNSTQTILSVRRLKKYFPIHKGFFRKVVGQVKAVDDVSFDLYEGETLGIVGESGCGKTTTGRCILRLIEPTEGSIVFNDSGNLIDMMTAERDQIRSVRKKLQIIFQDPYSSLNPRLNIERIVMEPLKLNSTDSYQVQRERVEYLLDKVGINPLYIERYPHEFSGGQRQRIGIARALALNPKVIVCDEPVSALDVSVQAQVMNLLKNLQHDFQLSYLFITHDFNVLYYMSDRILVMYLGKVVEIAPSNVLYSQPRHPYAEALIKSIAMADPRNRKRRTILEGTVPDAANPPKGCNFSTRCRYCTDICREVEPELTDIGDGHLVACHRVDEISLSGYSSEKEERKWVESMFGKRSKSF